MTDTPTDTMDIARQRAADRQPSGSQPAADPANAVRPAWADGPTETNWSGQVRPIDWESLPVARIRYLNPWGVWITIHGRAVEIEVDGVTVHPL